MMTDCEIKAEIERGELAVFIQNSLLRFLGEIGVGRLVPMASWEITSSFVDELTDKWEEMCAERLEKTEAEFEREFEEVEDERDLNGRILAETCHKLDIIVSRMREQGTEDSPMSELEGLLDWLKDNI